MSTNYLLRYFRDLTIISIFMIWNTQNAICCIECKKLPLQFNVFRILGVLISVCNRMQAGYICHSSESTFCTRGNPKHACYLLKYQTKTIPDDLETNLVNQCVFSLLQHLQRKCISLVKTNLNNDWDFAENICLDAKICTRN